jgi:PAS domain S-box-containing protein
VLSGLGLGKGRIMRVIIAHRLASYTDAIRQILTSYEIDGEGVSDFEELASKISQNKYDVIIIDSDFEGSERRPLITKLQRLRNSYPILYLYSDNEEQLAKLAIENGAAKVFSKRKGYVSKLPPLIKQLSTIGKKENMRFEQDVMPQATSSGAKEKNTSTTNKGYFICDRKGRFLSANNVIANLSQYSEDELLELNITDIIAKENEEEFFTKVYSNSANSFVFNFLLVNKFGEKSPIEMRTRILRDEDGKDQVIGFRGNLSIVSQSEAPVEVGPIDQNSMVNELIEIIQLSYSEPLNVLLNRVAEIVAQIFGFKRATVALLDRRKKVFIKQAMVGFGDTEDDESKAEQRAIEVPQEVINKIFADRFKIKVIYHTQDQRDSSDFLGPGVPDRRTQKRSAETEWHKRDLVLLNLTDNNENTFGYISLDEPGLETTPSRTIFYNLEMFGKLTAMAIENYYRYSQLEHRNRRLKQILVTSNIFKLYLSLSELLKEVVWSVKFSLNFNLITLVLISKKTGMLETKAVACDDKIKMLQLKELKYDLAEFGKLLKDEYRRNKSYFVQDQESILNHMKRIYYGAEQNGRYGKGWPNWALLLVPIKSREGKIIGFLLADDPGDMRLPNPDTIHILEIMANQIAIAIDNRVMYVQAKEQARKDVQPEIPSSPMRIKENETKEDLFVEDDTDFSRGGFKKLVERFLR